jgi:phenylacetic acid degradation operon negative regulatory protein
MPYRRGELSGRERFATRKRVCVEQPLARIISQLKREPSRTGSIVITVFGDAIVPRGGSVWLGTLLKFFEVLDIDSGVVRTAMSRLAADGWLERHKVGRNSFYRLARKGRQTFDAATRHIYDPQPSDWTGRFELLLIGNGEDRDASREALKNAGFGSRCRAYGSRRRAFPFRRKPQPRSVWKCPPRMTAAAAC